MKPYPRYKPTGLAWLPSVPEHWEVVKNRSFLRESCVLLPETKAQLLSVSQYDGVTPFPEDRKERVETLEGYKVVDKNDLVMNIMLAWNGSSGVSAHQGVVSPAYAVFKILDGANPRFIHYLFRSDCICDYFKAFSTGVVDSRLRLYPQVLARMWSPLPPPSEQDRIVRYLDEKTAAIDELVRAKEREIDLLRERKQALVSDAVTGREEAGREGRAGQEGQATPGTIGTPETSGPSVPEVPSVPNLSRPSRPSCPASPETNSDRRTYRLKELARFFKGLNITKADLIPEGANVISYGQIHSKDNDGRSLKDSFLRHTSFELTNDAARLSFGDIVFADTSEDQTGIGNCVLNDRHEPVWAGYHTVTARPRDPDIAPYLAILFQSNWWRDQLRRSSDGVKVYSVTQRSLGNTRVVLPPLPEQQRIVAHLDSVCSELDAAEAAIRKQIALLQELRTRLVSDAVTGAVEVS